MLAAAHPWTLVVAVAVAVAAAGAGGGSGACFAQLALGSGR